MPNQSEKHTLFQTKMVKIHTLFQKKYLFKWSTFLPGRTGVSGCEKTEENIMLLDYTHHLDVLKKYIIKSNVGFF